MRIDLLLVGLRQLRGAVVALAVGCLAWGNVGAQGLDQPLPLQQVAPSIWYVQGLPELGSSANQNFISNSAFVVTRTGVVVIDGLGSPALASRMLSAIKKITPLPVTEVLVTHYHADHIYGLQVYKAQGARIVAHRAALLYLNSETARLRMEASRQQIAPWIDASTQLLAADVWVDQPTELSLGGVLFRVQPLGPAHTPEDLAFYLPSERVLFAGDLVFRNRIPFVGQADSRRWIAALDQLLAFDARFMVPGHGPMAEQPQIAMTLTRRYLQYLRDQMGAAASAMEPFDEAYARVDWSQFAQIPMFGVAHRMNAYNTYLLMEHESR